MPERFTIGIEEEYQIIDPATRELKSHISAILEQGLAIMGEVVKPEMHQSVVEADTRICRNIKEAKENVTCMRKELSRSLAPWGLRIAAAGTHPFSDWKVQEITQKVRYLETVENMQDVARANLVFGLHVHIGIPDRDRTIDIMNAARYFLPHLLALSTSSHFWLGRATGLKSTRCAVFKKFPRTGIPDYFNSWAEYENLLLVLVKTGCVDDGKRIWWDIRPHPYYGTLEFRICDLPTKVEETIAIAALIQAIVVKLNSLQDANLGFRLYRRALIEENKWRAIRYGLDGKLIDFGRKAEVNTRDLMVELMEFVDNVVDDLGSREEIGYIRTILNEGTSADRQLRVYRESGGDLKKVVDMLMEETISGVS